MSTDPQQRTLVTGFTAFEAFAENPSAMLAERSGRRFELIEVSYKAADDFIERLDPSSFDRLLLMGVAGKSSRMRTENFAKNSIGQRVDVRGTVQPGQIEVGGALQLAGTLWKASTFAHETSFRRPSDDAGDYLCNYIYYRALQRFPDKAVGFLHVPPVEQMPIDVQLKVLAEILEAIEATT